MHNGFTLKLWGSLLRNSSYWRRNKLAKRKKKFTLKGETRDYFLTIVHLPAKLTPGLGLSKK
jgi:hypothetical protein